MLMRLKTLAFLTMCASPLYAQSADEGSQVSAEADGIQVTGRAVEQDSKAVQSTIALTHYVSARRTSDPLTQLSLGVTYQLTDRWSVSGEEVVSKLYNVYEDENEVQLSDGLLGLGYKFSDFVSTAGKTQWSLVLSTTLPLSESSRVNDVWTVSKVGLKAQHSFLGDKLTVTLRPAFAYHFNEYRSMGRDDDGTFLVRYRYIAAGELDYRLSKTWNLSYTGDWQQRHFEQPKRKGQNNSPDVVYSFSGSVSYRVQEKTSVGVGYAQRDRADLLGNVDVNLFDEEVSLAFVNLSHTL